MLNVVIQDHNRTTMVFPHTIAWQSLPRIGERIATEDRVFQVDMVTHDLTDGAIYITVSPL